MTSNPNTKIQISMGFLAGVWVLLDSLKDYQLDSVTLITCNALQRQVDEKLASFERREAFCKYKASPAKSNEREKFRKAYLDLAGIHKNWRSHHESLS